MGARYFEYEEVKEILSSPGDRESLKVLKEKYNRSRGSMSNLRDGYKYFVKKGQNYPSRGKRMAGFYERYQEENGTKSANGENKAFTKFDLLIDEFKKNLVDTIITMALEISKDKIDEAYQKGRHDVEAEMVTKAKETNIAEMLKNRLLGMR